MRVLVISDLHCSSVWQRIVDVHFSRVDKVVFLGDYVDSKDKNSDQDLICESCVENFRKILDFKKANKNKVELLLGNHDVQYITYLYRSTEIMQNCFEDIAKLIFDNLNLFNLFFIQDRWIFSHGGISERFWNDTIRFYSDCFEREFLVKDLREVFSKDLEFDNDKIDENQELMNFHWLASIGKKRGGELEYGSPLWADFTELVVHSKENIENKYLGLKGYFQAVGHSKLNRVLSYMDVENNQGVVFTDNLKDKKKDFEFVIIDTIENDFKKYRLYLGEFEKI